MKRIVQGQRRKCCFGCIYCFTKENYESNGQYQLDGNILQGVDLIQPFCDYDVFACENCDWKEELKKYVRYGKIISLATKAYIPEYIAEWLSEENKKLMKKGAFIHVGVSITTINSIEEIEPRAPSFSKRVNSLKNLQKYNVPCSVIIRPLLPVVHFDELKKIIDETYLYCDNFVYGPLYLNSEMKNYLVSKGIGIQTKEHQVNWRKNNPICEIFESDASKEMELKLISLCNEKGKTAFESNDAAVEDISRRIKYDE